MSHPRNQAPLCTVDGCDHPLHAAGLCRGHYARKERNQPVDSPLRQWGDPRQTLFEAALALGDVSDDDTEGMRQIRNFWRAFERASDARNHKVEKRGQSRGHGKHGKHRAPATAQDASR